MNRNRTGWKWLFHVGILTMLTALCLQAADKEQTSPAEPLPLDKVTRYLHARGRPDDTSTSLQNERAAKELIGKVYSGLVVIGDIEEHGKVITIADRVQGLHFWIEDAKLKEKAAQLRKGDKILIAARLKTIGKGVETLFVDVQSFDVQPKDRTKQTK